MIFDFSDGSKLVLDTEKTREECKFLMSKYKYTINY